MDLLHQVDMEITDAVVEICEKHGLKYFIAGGTMLGAIRHGGFIPWDDDIDLAMPRKDYEKFLKVAPAELPEHLSIVNYRTDPEYHYYITRVKDRDTKVEEVRIGNEDKYTNASIDIFPLDGTPNNKWLRKFYFFRVMMHRALMSLCYKDSIDRSRKRSTKEKIFLAVMEKLPIEKMFDPYIEKAKIDRIMRRQNYDRSERVGCLMGAYRTRQIVPREYFGEGKMYDFEDRKYRGPSMAHEYLTHLYGDYMKIPPKSGQKVHFKVIEIHGKRCD